MELINPFIEMTDEEARIEYEVSRRMIENEFGVKLEERTKYVPMLPVPVSKKPNKFVDWCQKAGKFIRDNISVNIFGRKFNQNIDLKNFRFDPNEMIKDVPFKGKLNIGPFEIGIGNESSDNGDVDDFNPVKF